MKKLISRRSFLIRAGFTGSCLCLQNSLESYSPPVTVCNEDYSIENTIFIQFCDEMLHDHIEKYSKMLGCKIYFGKDYPDLVAIPNFVAVVDRRTIGRRGWELYLNYIGCIQNGENYYPNEAPLIIIDQESRIVKPKEVKIDFHYLFPENISAITEIIEKAYKQRHSLLSVI